MLAVVGFYKGATPHCRLKISGMDPNTAIDFEADTGFDGFIMMPLSSAVPLGLVGRITTDVILADGSRVPRSVAEGIAQLEDLSHPGLIILQEEAQEVMVGMDFIRTFGLMLVIGKEFVLLANEAEVSKRAAAARPS